ncbi:cysteine and glycine-rich protein 1-like [Gigantopelta aegis]|uniref:cysteine and glycine-rich protein 1-like n=1 Tax=Gigantopelta aegis TaxID=1735272 RepID=UPI001B888245|nr:cysteine and glycine-rich protein 1-like [Gigantopelta aegis]XP_041367256.1 cysteine and glycine-rich protein 1-like [Gigantopelta aegis]
MPPVLGGSALCPQCSKPVYFAEEMRVLGKKFHKLCVKCNTCNKLLDSTTVADHDDKLYCRSCHVKNFGPKGYGFGAGGAGLSMGSASNQQNQNHLAQAQALTDSVAGGKLGAGSDVCPSCNRAVYFAEKIIGAGKSYHKACFRCNQCKKSLDSTTMTVHENDLFCKACYAKSFGPKGYGFAGGAYGLSMDTGNPYEVTQDNISHLAQAQAAPLMRSGSTNNQVGGGDICPRCKSKVYFAEKVIGAGQTWHKLCFKCSICNKGLDSSTVSEREGNVFCKACYGKNFGPKGFGYGQAMSYTE